MGVRLVFLATALFFVGGYAFERWTSEELYPAITAPRFSNVSGKKKPERPIRVVFADGGTKPFALPSLLARRHYKQEGYVEKNLLRAAARDPQARRWLRAALIRENRGRVPTRIQVRRATKRIPAVISFADR